MRNKSNLQKMNEEISLFWKKYYQHRDEFICTGNGEDSYLFIRYHKAYRLCENILRKHNISKNEFEAVLELMAIDNESQIVQKYCIELLNEVNIEKLINLSIEFSHYNSRWLIADLIGQIQNKKFEKHLELLIKDNHKYVQRRAILAMENINKEKYENYLFQFISDSDGYNRYVYLKCLREIGSKYLIKAITLLQNDENEFVKKELNLIKISESRDIS